MVLTKPLEKEDKPRKELLTKTQMWIQVYGLPFVAMTEKMGQMIGVKVGRLMEVKTDEEGMGMGACLAIRVEFDVRKKLMCRLRIVVEEDREFFVDFKYERLPAICYCCGVIGHNEADCALAIRKKKEGESKVAQYGKWLRAPMRQDRNRDKGGKGGRTGGGVMQTKEAGKTEDRSGGGTGSSQNRKEEGTEREKGNLVITDPPRTEREKRSKCLEPLSRSDGVDGKGEKALTLASSLQHGKEKELTETDEMVWQQVEEEGRQDTSWAADSLLSNMGRGETKSPKGKGG